MEHSTKIGLSFGLTSGIITTLGLMIGLYSSTNLKLTVLGGVLTIALADSLSDAFGIHISEESENVHTTKEIWVSTISTFLSKLFFSLTFTLPLLAFDLQTAVAINIIYGFLLLGAFSYFMNKSKKAMIEHILTGVLVIVLAYILGKAIKILF